MRALVDASGKAYVTGFSSSLDFPTSPGAFDRTNNGGFDVTLTKVNQSGSGLVYSTYLGGQGTDTGGGLVVNDAGEAYVSVAWRGWLPMRQTACVSVVDQNVEQYSGRQPSIERVTRT